MSDTGLDPGSEKNNRGYYWHKWQILNLYYTKIM